MYVESVTPPLQLSHSTQKHRWRKAKDLLHNQRSTPDDFLLSGAAAVCSKSVMSAITDTPL